MRRKTLVPANAPTLGAPQRLGILPTWSFWKRKDVSKERIVVTVSTAFPIGLGAGIILDHLPPHFWMTGIVALIGGGCFEVSFGLVERYLRRKMKQKYLREMGMGLG